METDNPIYDFESGGFAILSQEDDLGNLAIQGNIFVDTIKTNTHDGVLNINANTLFGAGATINMNGNIISNVGSPLASNDASNREYTDISINTSINGLFVKNPVDIATISSGVLSSSFSDGQTVDSVVLSVGNRLLIKNQINAIENGIYTVTIGTPTRAQDFPLGSNQNGSFVFVKNGNSNRSNGYICSAETDNVIVGTDNITFYGIVSTSEIIPGTGLSKTGPIVSVNTSQPQITSVGTLSDLTVGGQITSNISSGTAPFMVASNTVVGNLNVSKLLGNTWDSPGTIGSVTPNIGSFTNLQVSGQITSSLTTGTAPLVVTSNTVVGNLNAGLLAGFTWNSPGAIGSVTPNTGIFTDLTASGSVQGSVLVSTVATGTAPLSVTSNTVVGNLNASYLLGTTWSDPGPIGSGTASSGSFTSLSASSTITSSSTIQGTRFISTVAQGSPPLAVTSTTIVNNLNANFLSGATFASPGPIGSSTRSTGAFTTLNANSTISSSSSIQGTILISTIATGTAPLSVTSTTVVPNLNASLLNNSTFSSPGPIGNTTPGSGAFTTLAASSTVLSSSSIQGTVLISTVPTGTAPLSVASTSLVSNLNASLLGGATFSSPSPIGNTTPNTGAFTSLTANSNITSSSSIQGTVLISTVATGTAPFVVASTTIVPNLNASFLGGATFSNPGPIGSNTPGSASFTTLVASNQITSTVETGTAPFVVSSSTVVGNLNASKLLGNTWDAPGSIGNMTPDSGSFTSGSFSSSVNMNSNFINNLAIPISSTDAATKGYVDSVTQWMSPKNSVIAATVSNETLSTSFTSGSIIDGVTLATGERILIKNQTNSIENGIYVVNVSGSPSRSSDFDIGMGVAGAYVFVEQGTVNSNSGFICTSVTGSDIVGTDNIILAIFSGSAAFSAGTGLTKIGTTFSVNASQNQITSVGTLSELTVAGQITSTVSNGTSPFVVSSGSVVDNLNVSKLLGNTWDSPGTIGSVTPNTGSFTTLNSGSINISGQITSSVTTGTAPLVVTSITVVPNLNVGLLLGSTWGTPSSIGNVTPNTGAFTTLSVSSTIVGSSTIQGTHFISTITTGTAPLVVTSNTVIPNLNASLLGGATFAAPGPIGSTTPSTGAFTNLTASGTIIGNSSIQGTVLISTVATGTAPLTVASTSVVDNLNASLLNGSTFSSPSPIGGVTPNTGAFTTLTASSSINSSSSIQGTIFISTIASGTAPLSVASNTVVPNLNASLLGGATFASPGPIGSITRSTGAFTTVNANSTIVSSSTIQGTQIISTVATGTAPLTVASTSLVTNLNASFLGGATFAAPTSIGSTTPNTGAFTIVTASGQITSTVSSGTAPFVVSSDTVVTNLNASKLLGATWSAPLAIGSTVSNTGKFSYLNIDGSGSGTIGIGNTSGNYNLALPESLGTTGQFLTLADNTGTLKWSIPIIYYISDTKTAGTVSGTFTSGAWRTRTLNTITSSNDSGTDITLETNQINITPGTYSISISAPAYGCGPHACRLFNITTGLTVEFGSSATSNTGGGSSQSLSIINCSLTLSTTNVFEIQHRCSNNSNTNGFGMKTGFQTEVYLICQITKLI